MYYGKEYYKVRRYARSIISMIALFVIVDQVTRFALFWTGAVTRGPEIPDLFISVGIGFLITVIGFNIVSYIYAKRYVAKNIKKEMPVRDTDGTVIGKVLSSDNKHLEFVLSSGSNESKIPYRRVIAIGEGVLVHKA
jgi:sporulation protein YlmC with PRC-barrel domain